MNTNRTKLPAVLRQAAHQKMMPACLSFLVACLAFLPVAAQAHDVPNRHLIAKRPMFKQIAPIEDLSVEAEAAELFDQGVREYGGGNMPQAETLFERSLRLDPKNADAHFNLGAIKEWRNDLRSALRHYQLALSLKPQDMEIADAVQSVEYKIRNKPALDAQAAKEKREQDMATHGRMAKDAFAAQNFREAAMHLTYLAHAMPDDPKIQFALGQSLRALKYYDWSAYRLKMAIFLEPENQLYRKTLVDLDREMQEAHGQAFSEAAAMALSKLHQPSFTELTDSGFRAYAF